MEKGSEEFERQLSSVREIIVAPFYWVEFHSAIARRRREKTVDAGEASRILQEAGKDLIYFSRVEWNEFLEEKALDLVGSYFLKTLDSLQLASGIVSGADLFLTSDRNLFVIARKELKGAKLI